MKFPCTLKNALLIIRDRFGLYFATKGLGYLAALLLLLPLLACYKLSCDQTTLLLTISALADSTLLKTTCHFLLLLVGLDTLTYWKELQFIPNTCGSSLVRSSCSPLVYFESVRSGPLVLLYYMLKLSSAKCNHFWSSHILSSRPHYINAHKKLQHAWHLSEELQR